MPNDDDIVFDKDNPEWTADDFAKARPISEFPELAAAFDRAKRGRPVGSTKADAKVQVTLRIDSDVIAAFKSSGPGWQSRMNAALRDAVSKDRPAAA